MRKPYQRITRIDAKAILPHATELAQRCESCEKAAKYAGIGTGTMYRLVVYREYETVQMETARRILDALIRKRQEDRTNGHVSEQFRRARALQAIVEDRLERQSGY